jgi:hypothetical protein
MKLKYFIPAIFLFYLFQVSFSQNENRFKRAELTESQVKPFFEFLKESIKNSDKVKLSLHVQYPIKVYISENNVKTKLSKRTTIHNAKEFLAHYDLIINKKVRNAVIKQSYDSLFCNWQGVMIGNGEIWINSIVGNDSLFVIAINN